MPKKKTNSEKIDALSAEQRNLTEEFKIHRVALAGDESLGVKGPFDRIFILFSELPCKEHSEKIIALETKAAINCHVNKERRRIYNILRRILLPGAGGAGILAIFDRI